MNRYRLALHAGVKGVDVRLDDPSGPYYLAEDVHHLLRRVQRQRFHAAQCRCWDCDALQKDIAATLGEEPNTTVATQAADARESSSDSGSNAGSTPAGGSNAVEISAACEHDWWRTADRPGQYEDTCLICGAVRDAT